jgi:hypothetical protein
VTLPGKRDLAGEIKLRTPELRDYPVNPNELTRGRQRVRAGEGDAVVEEGVRRRAGEI